MITTLNQLMFHQSDLINIFKEFRFLCPVSYEHLGLVTVCRGDAGRELQRVSDSRGDL